MYGKPYFLTACALALCAPFMTMPASANTPSASPSDLHLSPTEERISDLVRVWYFTRLFHPDLIGRESEWNAALVAAVEPTRAANDDTAFAAVVDAMLAKAGGSSASAPPAASTMQTPEGGAPPPFRLVDGAAVVDCAALGDALADHALKDMDPAIPSAIAHKGMVVDCRHFVPNDDDERRLLQFTYSDDWLRTKIGTATSRALFGGFNRVRFHDGYPPPSLFNFDEFKNGLADIAFPPVTGSSTPSRFHMTFLLGQDAPSATLWIATAAQAAGLGRIVMEGDPAAFDRHALALRHVNATIRVAYHVSPDGKVGFRPDACVPDARDADSLSQAIALLDPAATASGCKPPATQSAPAMPAAQVPELDPGSAPDLGTRILALAQLWGTIQYFYPYQSLLDHPWNDQLDRFVGRFIAAQDRAGYEDVVRRMARQIDDSHIAVTGLKSVPPLYAPPLYIRPVGTGFAVVKVRDAAAARGVLPGDELTSVDGKPVAAVAAAIREVTAASTPQAAKGAMARLVLTGTKDSVVRVGLRRNGKIVEVALTRTMPWRDAAQKPRDGKPAWYRLAPGIGYIDLDRLLFSDADKAMDELLDTKALIFDLRGYPNGTAWPIAPRLSPDNKARVVALFQRPQYRGVGEPLSLFTSSAQNILPSAKAHYKGRVIVMIDDRAQSQAEHTGLLFAAETKLTFIGTPTTGANGDVSFISLPGGLQVRFTGHDIRFADGRQLQRVGIIPDITVAPTLAGLRAGRDEVLEAALRVARAPAAKH